SSAALSRVAPGAKSLSGLLKGTLSDDLISVRGVSKYPRLSTINEVNEDVSRFFNKSMTINPESVSALGITTGDDSVREVSFAFEEINSRGTLNILSHMGRDGVEFDSGVMDAQKTLKHLEQNVKDFSSYNTYNFLGCDSEQLARNFSTLVRNKQVLGFSGPLTQINKATLNRTLDGGDAYSRISNGSGLLYATRDLQRELGRLSQRELTLKFVGLSRYYIDGFRMV
ncbi:hypothetical protein, partial [Enterobacter bugandensis]|uniref:hypothetical protein n=1 Tax=Enterobacter bugandensis TaxID=881260 RepID=UPI000AB86E61